MFPLQSNTSYSQHDFNQMPTASEHFNSTDTSGIISSNFTASNTMAASTSFLRLCELCQNPETVSLKLVNTLHGLRHQTTCENVSATGLDIAFHQIMQTPMADDFMAQQLDIPSHIESDMFDVAPQVSREYPHNDKTSQNSTADAIQALKHLQDGFDTKTQATLNALRQEQSIQNVKTLGSALEEQTKNQLRQVRSDLNAFPG